MSNENLKKKIETLSEQDLSRIKTLKKINEIVKESSVEEMNKMPLLYRLELRKALEELGEDEKAQKIDT